MVSNCDCGVASLAAVIAVVVASIYFYYRQKLGFWSRKGVKGPQPWPIVGNTLSLFSTPMYQTDNEYVQKYGKVYGFYEGTKPILGIADPDLIKRILVKDFSVFPDRRENRGFMRIMAMILANLRGEEWRSTRAIMTPTFTSGKIKQMYGLMKGCVAGLEDALKAKANTGQNVELKHLLGCYTMDVIAKCCFATNTNSFKDQDSVFVTQGRNFFKFPVLRVFAFLMLPDWIKGKIGFTMGSAEPVNFFEAVTRKLLKTRRADPGKKHNDFLQILTDAGKNASTEKPEEDNADDFHVNESSAETKEQKHRVFDSTNLKKKTLTDDEIVAQSILFFAAGYETTGSLLTFTLYLLALHPEIQQELYLELKPLIGADGEFDYEKLSHCEYLDAVISEVLRIYPPAVRLERTNNAEYTLADGLTIPKGSIIHIPTYAIHHSAEYYHDPEEFIPKRFLAKNRDQLVPYTYLPFGAGPRNCIGMRFALIEAKLALSKLVIGFKFRRSPQTVVPIDFGKSRNLLQVASVIVKVDIRD